MSDVLKEELKEILPALRSYARAVTTMVDMLERTINNPNATNNHVMDLIVELKQHPWVDKSKLGTALTGVHKSLFRDAQAKLAAKVAADKEALAERNPFQFKKKT